MTTKQPPAQKHLDKAKEIVDKINQCSDDFKHTNEHQLDTHFNFYNIQISVGALERVLLNAIEQVETEALASKVEIPTDGDIKKAMGGYITIEQHELLDWLRSQLTLAPNEQTKECQCEELKQMIQKAQDNLKKNMELLTAPNEQVIRAPKKMKTGKASYAAGFNDYAEAIKRLNPQARIEESNE